MSWISCNECMYAERLDDYAFYCTKWRGVEQRGCPCGEEGYPGYPSWEAKEAYARWLSPDSPKTRYKKSESSFCLKRFFSYLFGKKEESDFLQEATDSSSSGSLLQTNQTPSDSPSAIPSGRIQDNYIITRVKAEEKCLRKYGTQYDHMLQELINANTKEHSGMIWEAEHAGLYAIQDMEQIIPQAVRKTKKDHSYWIPQEDFEILDEIFQELSAIRWHYHRKLYDERFVYDRRY